MQDAHDFATDLHNRQKRLLQQWICSKVQDTGPLFKVVKCSWGSTGSTSSVYMNDYPGSARVCEASGLCPRSGGPEAGLQGSLCRPELHSSLLPLNQVRLELKCSFREEDER